MFGWTMVYSHLHFDVDFKFKKEQKGRRSPKRGLQPSIIFNIQGFFVLQCPKLPQTLNLNLEKLPTDSTEQAPTHSFAQDRVGNEA